MLGLYLCVPSDKTVLMNMRGERFFLALFCSINNMWFLGLQIIVVIHHYCWRITLKSSEQAQIPLKAD